MNVAAYRSATKCAKVCHPLEQHYLLLNVAIAGWKGCIAYLAEEVQGQVTSPGTLPEALLMLDGSQI